VGPTHSLPLHRIAIQLTIFNCEGYRRVRDRAGVSAGWARHPERASLDLAARNRLSGGVQAGPDGTRLRTARRCDHSAQQLAVAGIAVGLWRS
jgi:hypothetical protein